MPANMPKIDLEKCNGCELCVNVCSCNALVMVNNIITCLESKECNKCTKWCTMCEDVCPTEAIVCAFEIIIEED